MLDNFSREAEVERRMIPRVLCSDGARPPRVPVEAYGKRRVQ